jgi:intracellular septation protein A
MDRRAIFFLVAAVLCAALTFALDELQWVTIALAILYAIFAVLSWLDWMGRRRS